ncbi:uncharacterized protein LOC116202001 isoform X2 [Punica granatum]|uniref:Uncharacterized protein LOC116202001 isoform X2 n=1 Tax=Punica granatum TaxID=22663 RepID=A0A6P8D760_PUNGR|nr:uncharacterized protein LOC116202001 isoform X2 [Punica granatum]
MAQQPYDRYYKAAAPLPDYTNPEIKTLFISGLPDDVKAREIHNLFRHRPGFDACQLKYTGRGNQVVAFATFFSHQSAIAALRALNGVKFDPDTGCALHIELARTNSWRKRKPGDVSASKVDVFSSSGPYVVIDNRDRNNAQGSSSDDGGSESDDPSETDKQDSGDEDDVVNAKSGGSAGVDGAEAAVSNEDKATEGNTQACSTLFFANLGPKCTEDELKQVLSQYPGFNVLKMRGRGGLPVAFADFEEIEQATKAMEELQDTQLESSDRGGLHIEYARSKMRKR